MNIKNPHRGKSWEDFKQEILTPAERAELEAKTRIVSEMIEARKAKKISQKDLEELSGIKQPMIARIETGKSMPQLDTLLKVLASMGKTLKIVDIDQTKPAKLTR